MKKSDILIHFFDFCIFVSFIFICLFIYLFGLVMSRHTVKNSVVVPWFKQVTQEIFIVPTLPHPPFHPSPILTYCWMLSTSFRGKGPHLRRWLVAHPCICRFPNWGFPRLSSAVREMPGDLCTANRGVISLSPLSLASDVTEMTLGASGLWLGTRTGAGGTATLAWCFFWPQPMAPWTQKKS